MANNRETRSSHPQDDHSIQASPNNLQPKHTRNVRRNTRKIVDSSSDENTPLVSVLVSE